jgi:hypothetical protein
MCIGSAFGHAPSEMGNQTMEGGARAARPRDVRCNHMSLNVQVTRARERMVSK